MTTEAVFPLQLINETSQAGRGRAYRAYPGRRQPLWLLPNQTGLHNAGLRLYLPQSPLGTLRKAAMRIGLGGALVSLDRDELGRLEERIADELEQEQVRLAFYTGTPSAYRKATLHVMDASGRPLAYAKAASSANAKALVSHEADVLAEIESQASVSERVPERLGLFEHDGVLFLLIGCGPDRSGPAQLGDGHLHLLENLEEAFGNRLEFESTSTFHGIRRRLDSYSDRLTDEWKSRYQGALSELRMALSGLEVRTNLAHHDFTPWNTRLGSDGSIFVFDWEFARKDALASIDLFHFVLMSAIHLRSSKPLAALTRRPGGDTDGNRLPYDAGRAGALLRQQPFSRFERPDAHFLAYLVHLGLSYHELLFERDGEEDDQVLKQVASLLDSRYQWGSFT